ncbi:MAG: hypothetical protein HC927_10710 [Deltaproteobacteria bacterium]|nr:hypothetical protein [Deltaproteobacteria bacterium]
MNKGLFLFLILGGNIFTVIAVALAQDPKTTEMIAAVPVGLLLAAIGNLVMIYKMWAAIQGPTARTSPGKAVGFLFIPIFNIYWLFNVLGGWATDYEKYRAAKGLAGAPQASSGLLVGYAVMTFISIPVLNWIIQGMAISNVANCVNGLKAAQGR